MPLPPEHDLPPLLDGWTRVHGEWKPRKGLWHIQLRCGFADSRIAYEPRQITWPWGDHAGDVVAVRRVK